VVSGFFPLDEQLQLSPGALAPDLAEHLVRLSSRMPFECAVEELYSFTHTHISEPTARRLTLGAGRAWVELETAEAQRIERELAPAPKGPAFQQLSVDGAMVPLVGGEWAEVKTLAIGTLSGQPLGEEVKATELSYFSRMTDSDTFTDLALVETHRRGVETAGVVAAVNDGALWEQGFVDAHRPDALRVLDFGHAAGYLSIVAQAVYGPGTRGCVEWIERWRHELRRGDPQVVLDALRKLQMEASGEVAAVVGGSLQYLEARREQIRYAEFELLGIPIGSGIVESACKLVVEARLKGSGMHWARGSVNPMVALRNVLCGGRWQEVWPSIVGRLRQSHAERTRVKRQDRLKASEPVPKAIPTPAPLAVAVEVNPEPQPASQPSQARSRRPAADHPWRRYPRQPPTDAATRI